MPTTTEVKAIDPKKPMFWLLAFVAAVGLFLAAVPLHLYYGKTLPQALSAGAATAICGLACWWVYHLVSRRNDGLVILGWGMFSGQAYEPYRSFWFSLGILCIFLPMAAIGGYGIRLYMARKESRISSDPMFDLEADRAIDAVKVAQGPEPDEA